MSTAYEPGEGRMPGDVESDFHARLEAESDAAWAPDDQGEREDLEAGS